MRRWVWRREWPDLRDVQELAIPAVLAADRDVIIAAATASGKTEAAFLPICSALLNNPGPGIRALYVSPLKALINDQYRRLDDLCEQLDIPVHRWHGDVAAAAKAKVFTQPEGILLITPESLEAMFVLRGPEVSRVFTSLGWVVVDEMHSFVGGERGAQLQSLLHRLELAVRRTVPRIGLSATLGDMAAAADFLRPGGGGRVRLIESNDRGAGLKLLVRGYVEVTPEEEVADEPVSSLAIADDLYEVLRGGNHLVFANRRGAAEYYADRLRAMSDARGVPNEFFPHHGNLAKHVREQVEEQLRSARPTTAICTSTLEMGIDIGTITSVAQIGAPPSVAGLRQRFGRSGRRGSPAELRIHVAEPEIAVTTPPTDQLRAELFQTVAMIDLLGERWFESSDLSGLHLSTLVQQVLSVIAQHQGAAPEQLWKALCGNGPFHRVDQKMFAQLLRDLGKAELIEQEPGGLLLLGPVGERIVGHYSFYAAFASSDEYRLVHGSRTLGTIPVLYPVMPGQLLVFAGRRWQVLTVDSASKVIELDAARGGRAPSFTGVAAEVRDEIRQRMRRWYESGAVPPYLDATARKLLAEGRDSYRRLNLAEAPVLAWGNDTVVFPWLGDRVLDTLAVWLTTAGLETSRDGVALSVSNCGPAELGHVVRRLLACDEPADVELAAAVPNTVVDKHDVHLGPSMRAYGYAKGHLNLPKAREVLKALAETLPLVDPDPIDGASVGRPEAPARGLPFAVVDLETTGFAPRRRDRIIEIAIVRLAPDGTVLSEWSSVVDPQRGVNASWVHGLTDADVVGAPTFAEIAHEVAAQLDGVVLVAHNLPFERRFLEAELERADLRLTSAAGLCTMEADRWLHGEGRRKLVDCLAAAGVEAGEPAHRALTDARMTAQLLRVQLPRLEAAGGCWTV
ncbi:DEAD/DEAH box helicase [Lentzea sp. NEAU-D7]|uniref:DEAD/DEAH box helicase n=1 Tax=Lentzea sp. NEAU-D7 TaxID=2994667 RepID=UPI00224AE5BB|nr:DEAD/DEAH box helicase [Lentzea sp. NEAU-D7]MCX2949688.1 DEAD/DEAH box helicase [Lentzea sp. NEAU-D7]